MLPRLNSGLDSPPVLPARCNAELPRFAARFRGLASGLALPSGPLGRQRLRVQGWVLKILSAERLERIFGCPCGWTGWPGQCAAFRPVTVTFPGDSRSSRVPDALVLTDGRGTGQIRRSPQAAGHRATGCGSSARRRAFARRARRKLPHRLRRVPGSDPGRRRRATLAAHPSARLAAPASRGSRQGRQARRAEGAPLKT